jgi:hypothetical protein
MQSAIKSALPGIQDEISNIVKKCRDSTEEFRRLLLIAQRELEILFCVPRRLICLNYQAACSGELTTDERCRDGPGTTMRRRNRCEIIDAAPFPLF